MLLRLDQPEMEDAPLDPIPAAGWSLRTHTSNFEESNRPRDSCERQEDGSDERGRHRHEWEDDRPMGSSLGRDNDGSSYA